MSVESIKQEIEQYKNEIIEKVADLEKDRAEIIEAIKPFIKEKSKSLIENEVKSNPEHTMKLGVQALGNIKKQLATLLDTSDTVVDNVFSNDNVWKHLNYTVNLDGDTWGQRRNNASRAEESIEIGIKSALGKAGKIIIDNGYKKVGTYYDRAAEWQEDNKSEIRYGSQRGLSLPKGLKTLIGNYCDALGPLHDDVEKLEKLKVELSKQEAIDLWDQA